MACVNAQLCRALRNNPEPCGGAQSGHALVGALMPEYDPVTKISIVPRGQAGGLTFFAPSEERLESGLYRCAPALFCTLVQGCVS